MKNQTRQARTHRRSWAARRSCLRVLFLATIAAIGTATAEETGRASPAPDYSGWRGGIGLACENPSDNIHDISELGYDICWGWDNPQVARALDVAAFRYWDSIIETSLKSGRDPQGEIQGTWDFSQMADKNEAARLAFDAWGESRYGVKGLSKCASVRYAPNAFYDVGGAMDLSSENPLVKAVEERYLAWFAGTGVRRGGIALDNATKMPKAFLESLNRHFNPRGLGIATNGCPDEFLHFIDIFGNEGFPFSIEYAREAHKKGLHGILGEFTMQHLSGGELEAYLKNKQFNGIVFFGYIGASSWNMGHYSRYDHRPDVYDHQRWVFRKYVPLSRSMRRAGRQEDACARLAVAAPRSAPAPEVPSVEAPQANEEGKVQEYRRPVANLEKIAGRSPATTPGIVRYGDKISDGIYLYADSGTPAEVVCPADKLGIRSDTLVFDEFNEKMLPGTLRDGRLTFRTITGPSLIELGNKATLIRSVLSRSEEGLKSQLAQRALDRELKKNSPSKAWENFCQGWSLDRKVAHAGSCSLKTEGGTYFLKSPRYSFFNRQGAAQLVPLNQTKPDRITLKASSMAENVVRSDCIDLNDLSRRRDHFAAREGHLYCVHLYLDYQDGQWPEVHTAAFAPGTHGWEDRTIEVNPTRPVKTAMVLLEFHQPQGTAWFDDIVLKQGEPDGNLIASGGFEERDPAAERALDAGQAYDRRIDSLITTLDAARSGPRAASELAALMDEADAAAAWVRNRGLSPYFTRELRDLDDLREKLQLCSKISAAD